MERKEVSLVIKGPHEDGDRNVLYPDCINVSILSVILYCNFVRYYTGGNQITGTGDLFIISYNFIVNLKFPQNEKLKEK